MDFTRQELEDAELLLVVDEHGHYKWSSNRSDNEIVLQLRRIATHIAENWAKKWVGRESDVCVIHLSPRAVEEDASVCWEYDGQADCRFTSTHEATQ